MFLTLILLVAGIMFIAGVGDDFLLGKGRKTNPKYRFWLGGACLVLLVTAPFVSALLAPLLMDGDALEMAGWLVGVGYAIIGLVIVIVAAKRTSLPHVSSDSIVAAGTASGESSDGTVSSVEGETDVLDGALAPEVEAKPRRSTRFRVLVIVGVLAGVVVIFSALAAFQYVSRTSADRAVIDRAETILFSGTTNDGVSVEQVKGYSAWGNGLCMSECTHVEVTVPGSDAKMMAGNTADVGWVSANISMDSGIIMVGVEPLDCLNSVDDVTACAFVNEDENLAVTVRKSKTSPTDFVVRFAVKH